jgi:hypothetical protein
MTRKRRSEVRAQTLAYLGDLLQAHPDSDSGLYDGLNDEEGDYAKAIAEQEGAKLRARAEKTK